MPRAWVLAWVSRRSSELAGGGKGEEKRKNEKEMRRGRLVRKREKGKEKEKKSVRDCFRLKSRIYSIFGFSEKISFSIVLRRNFDF